MEFKIRHEEKSILIILGISLLIFFLSMFTMAVFPSRLLIALNIICSMLMVLFMILYWVEQAVRTTITIENTQFRIKHLFMRKKVKYADIATIGIEHYSRRRKQGRYSRYTEHRLRMAVTLKNGKTIILTDSATHATMKNYALTFIKPETIPDELVPLYKACEMIKFMMK